MSPGVELRRLTGADVATLSAEVDRARAADEMRASSDDHGTFLARVFAMDPTIVGGAWAGPDLVGFVSSEFKITWVRPERRRHGIGRRLIDLVEEMERDRGRPEVIMGRMPDDEPAREFLVATRFAFHSVLWDLTLEASTEIAPPAWPAGVVARTIDPDRDIERWVELFNSAFASHATPLQIDPEFARASRDDPDFDAADTLVVEDESGALVAFCAVAPVRHGGVVEPHGEIWTVGVRPDLQGMGLGRQLLRWGAGYLRSIGVTDIALSVNGRNERALGLYESEGFVRTRTRERWARPVGPP